MGSLLRVSKEKNSIKNEGGVTVLNLCTSSNHALYSSSFTKILNGFQKF